MKIQNDKQLGRLFASLPVGVGIYEYRDQSLYPIFVNDVTYRYFGITRAEYEARMESGKPLFVMEDVQAFVRKFAAGWDGGPLSREVSFEFRTRRMDGAELWLRVQGQLEARAGENPFFYTVMTDLTEEKRARKHSRWQNKRYRILNELTHAVSFDYDSEMDTMSYYIDPDGRGVQERMLEHYLERVIDSPDSVVHPDSTAYAEAFRQAQEGQLSGTAEYRANYFGAGYRWYRADWHRIMPEEGEAWHLVGLVKDIEEELELRRKAEVDGVTRIANRSTTEERINQKLVAAHRTGVRCVCAVLDIDNFKAVNDSCGHIEGDELLQRLGSLLKVSSSEEDIVGRIGGDEFVVFFDGEPLKNVLLKLEKVELKSRDLVSSDGTEHISLSIGVCVTEADDLFYEDVIRKADKALYLAKRKGKNRIEVYRPGRETGK